MRYEVTSTAAKALDSLWDELGPLPFLREKPERWDEGAVAGLLAGLCSEWKLFKEDGEDYWRELHRQDEAAVSKIDHKRRSMDRAQIQGVTQILKREAMLNPSVQDAIEGVLERTAPVSSVIFEDKPKPITPAARSAFEQDAARVLFALGWNIADTAVEIERLLILFDFRELKRPQRIQLPDANSIASRIRGLYTKKIKEGRI